MTATEWTCEECGLPAPQHASYCRQHAPVSPARQEEAGDPRVTSTGSRLNWLVDSIERIVGDREQMATPTSDLLLLVREIRRLRGFPPLSTPPSGAAVPSQPATPAGPSDLRSEKGGMVDALRRAATATDGSRFWINAQEASTILGLIFEPTGNNHHNATLCPYCSAVAGGGDAVVTERHGLDPQAIAGWQRFVPDDGQEARKRAAAAESSERETLRWALIHVAQALTSFATKDGLPRMAYDYAMKALEEVPYEAVPVSGAEGGET